MRIYVSCCDRGLDTFVLLYGCVLITNIYRYSNMMGGRVLWMVEGFIVGREDGS
jgi:hypothetical protein